jgi:hypothetical protein
VGQVLAVTDDHREEGEEYKAQEGHRQHAGGNPAYFFGRGVVNGGRGCDALTIHRSR